MLAKVIDSGLGAFGHALHELLSGDVPLVGLPRSGVNPRLTDTAVGTAYADVLVATAKSALGVPFEMGESNQGVVILQMAAHAHTGEPLATHDRQGNGVLFVEDVDGCEGPAVHLDGLAMLFSRVAVTLVIGIGFDDAGTLQVLCH